MNLIFASLLIISVALLSGGAEAQIKDMDGSEYYQNRSIQDGSWPVNGSGNPARQQSYDAAARAARILGPEHLEVSCVYSKSRQVDGQISLPNISTIEDCLFTQLELHRLDIKSGMTGGSKLWLFSNRGVNEVYCWSHDFKKNFEAREDYLYKAPLNKNMSIYCIYRSPWS